ncbi:hypothetical protein N7513_013124 [Penicillium frequentans]|nr:hypothetical protein N7513_013124 [Penicillium glabrum]
MERLILLRSGSWFPIRMGALDFLKWVGNENLAFMQSHEVFVDSENQYPTTEYFPWIMICTSNATQLL